MRTQSLGAAEYRWKFAREALAGGKAKGLSPLELQPLVEEERAARSNYNALFFTLVKQPGPVSC